MSIRRRGTNSQIDEDLLTRTSFVDARIAYKQVKKGKADGNKCALWVRWHLQDYMFSIGCFIQLHCGKVLFMGLLLLSLCCIGFKLVKFETDVEALWVEAGGRLEEELAYTKATVGVGSGTTSELVIQTPKEGSNILTQKSLLLHLETLLRVTEIEVDLFETTWKFNDICYLAEFPIFDDTFIDGIIQKITPCVIITPLDCFWDGAKVLGPHNSVWTTLPIPPLKWKSLDPQSLIEYIENNNAEMIPKVELMKEIMKEAGITTGYQERPCLDPTETQCPDSAPNKHSGLIPDIGAELTNGCTGFAENLMQWHEDLIVGGAKKNKTGHIVRAEAMQSVVQLMAEKSLYEFWQDDYKVHSIEWSQDKAKQVLETWQRKFIEVVSGMTGAQNTSDSVYAFATTSLLDMMTEFSGISVVRVAFGYILMIIYACVSLLKWNNAVQSQSGIGIAGVLLIALSVAAGLGICCVLGIPFNAATTQIIPFLALGLGVDDMFLIAHTYSENAEKKNIPLSEQTGECLKRTGVTILLTSFNNMLAFFTAAIIPIPALRAFSLQAAILILFNLASIVLVYPAICSMDLQRKDDKRIDIFCCFQSFADTRNLVMQLQPQHDFQSRDQSPPPSYSPPQYSPSPPPSYASSALHNTVTQTAPDGIHTVTSLAPNEGVFVPRGQLATETTSSSSRQCLTPEEGISCHQTFAMAQKKCLTATFTSLAKQHYIPFLQKKWVKVFTIVGFLVLLFIGIYGTAQVKDGLDLTDVVPKDTNEYKFLKAQSKYFGFYNVYMVTKDGFDYPNNQHLLRDYHRAFQTVDNIIKKQDNSMPDFWLDMFRDWLKDIQVVFEREVSERRIHADGWYYNASDKAILGYKLMLQTGDLDNPTDKTKVFQNKLVNDDGVINTEAFYNYLTAWVSNDAMTYAASMADFHPIPSQWVHDSYDIYDHKIPKAQPLIYAQIPFYLSNLSTTEAILETIKAMREICDTYTDRGLPNYPNGIPFTFWEQYIKLRLYLSLAILCILIVTFIVLTVVLMNPWLASIIVVVLTVIIVELFGLMGLCDIKLSAVPAVILIITAGIGVEFTVHISVGFLTAIGSRNKRMGMSLEHTLAPVIHGAISTFMGIIMLVGAEFEFIVKYFFNVLAGLVVIGLLNGLVLLPVLLSILGPKGEVRPKDDGDRIPTPSPEPSPKPIKKTRKSRPSRRLYPRIPSDISLTTISEEPTQYSSHEIIVEPEVVVETTTVPMGGTHSSNSSSRHTTPPASVSSTPQSTHVTRVTAHATVKVEVHTPIPGSVQSVDHDHVYKSKRRKELDSSDSDSCSNS
ncbi:protein patched homolog 1-like [Mytilus californianus]|uniref:protein patched homolog 1-like n=1 Tax=Mytilus californianus TaxID=6549 RepID=UPI002246095D|nr:protein patched homolog 1-like [Mytilus californianus]